MQTLGLKDVCSILHVDIDIYFFGLHPPPSPVKFLASYNVNIKWIIKLCQFTYTCFKNVTKWRYKSVCTSLCTHVHLFVLHCKATWHQSGLSWGCVDFFLIRNNAHTILRYLEAAQYRQNLQIYNCFENYKFPNWVVMFVGNIGLIKSNDSKKSLYLSII